MALVPGWDNRRGSGEFSPRSPDTHKLSASASLNAAILAKKDAEAKAAADKAAKAAARAALNQPELEKHASGWWSATDAGQQMNVEDEHVEKKAVGFTPQFGLTGQSGMGNSMFSIQRSSLDAGSAPAPSGDSASSAVPIPASGSSDSPTVGSPILSAVRTSSTHAVGSPSRFAPPAHLTEDEKKGWWGKMDAGQLNHAEAEVQKGEKSGFTPQFMGSSGLVNRLVPLDSSGGSGSLSTQAPASAPVPAQASALSSELRNWDPFTESSGSPMGPGTPTAQPTASPGSPAKEGSPTASARVSLAPPAHLSEDEKKGWWGKMDAGQLNHAEAEVQKGEKSGFTPQFMGSSGLVNRLVPLGSSPGGSGSLGSPAAAPAEASKDWDPFKA
mmetsp:Transcript_19458/g.42145  ORF Transcript_19458/g.42145 Transcript_19458/m.42145 type:complete len:386 (+) Transcript_19458:147-1304(+)